MIWTSIDTTYDRKTDETVVIVKGLHKTVEKRKKGMLLTLDNDFKMRQLQREAIKELNEK